jgi:hypothetical protein
MNQYCHHRFLGRNKLGRKELLVEGLHSQRKRTTSFALAFLNISKDPITGVNQNIDAYYKRIYDYYHEHKLEGSVRSQISLQKRWVINQKVVTKFCGFKSAVDRRNESRKNEYDKVNS